MKVIVLGAGVVGVTTAWYLRQHGHEVAVVDANDAAGMATSYANGGQITVSHAEPWANPQAPRKILAWLGREDAPLLFRLRLDVQQWSWGLRFLRECSYARTRANTSALVSLGLYSRAALQALRAQTGIAYDHATRGILHLFQSTQEFDHARRAADAMRGFGLTLIDKNAAECVAVEPALAGSRTPLAGGVYSPDDESGDAHKFTQQLAALCAASGVAFEYDALVLRLRRAGTRITSVTVRLRSAHEVDLQADAFVVALGCGSTGLLRDVGIKIPVYPAKGYSVTLAVGPAHQAPQTSLTDEAHKLVFSRLGDRLRVAGTAELNGYALDLNHVRCEAILRRVFELFPNAGERSAAQLWAGLRPATPSNVPLIGATRYDNLFLNTGHGTLGWTLACGSAKALAQRMSGGELKVAFPFLG